MISKGNTHSDGAKLAAYLTTSKDGERAELWQLKGFGTTDLKDAFRDVQIMAGATKCEQPFFHVQVRNREGESLTRQQWEHAADRIGRMMGLGDQPRAIAFHIDEITGEDHMHVAWSRIDEETLTAKDLPFFKLRLKKISRELELHFGLEPVTNRREGPIRFAPTRAEDEQARRLGLDVHEIRNAIRNCWDRSDCGTSFQAALEHEGMTLAQGEKRDFVIIDREGGIHALGKRIVDMTASKIRDRLSDISRDELPTVEMVRAGIEQAHQQKPKLSTMELLQAELQEIDGLIYATPSLEDIKREAEAVDRLIAETEARKREEEDEPLWDRDHDDRVWQDAVIKAAIEKEKAERQFVEPEQRETRNGAGNRKDKSSVHSERPLNEAAAAIRLAWSLSRTPEDFIRHLDETGFRLARATADEAYLSHRNASFAKAAGRYMPEYRDGQYVAISDRGFAFGLNERTTGESLEDVADFMRTIDPSSFRSIGDTQQHISENKRPAAKRELWENDRRRPERRFNDAAQEVGNRRTGPDDVKGPSAEIWQAYERSDNARAFANALQDKAFTIAVVTGDDVSKSHVDRLYATDIGRNLPPTLKEGDFVVVADNGRAYNLNRRTTGETAERMQKFMATLDRTEFEGVYATFKGIEERGALWNLERQAFRDLSAGKPKQDKDARPSGRLGRPQRGKDPGGNQKVGGATLAAARIIGKTFDVAGDAIASLFAPTLSPQQIHDGDRAKDRREIEADQTLDFSRYTAETAQQRQEVERELARERERPGRER